MGQALYRKHRPKKLGQVVGQEHVTRTLEQALKQGRISHAYLFTGPRGVGKTSIARILAHEINGLAYEDDSSHIDIIEIDAASNRRIDEIRELRDKVYIAPASAKYKVYIIDEVHMLTKEAFNALLKTLEEPPEHAVFILATTEAHKIPETIISRTQRFSFKPVGKAEVAAHLADLAKKEKIRIDSGALELLAAHGEGSFRDSISMLDQLGGHEKKVGTEEVRRMLGIPPADAIAGLLDALEGRKGTDYLMSALSELFSSGYQAAGIASQIGRSLRERLVRGDAGLSRDAALGLMEKLISVPAAHDPERYLEITLLGAVPATDAPAPRRSGKPAQSVGDSGDSGQEAPTEDSSDDPGGTDGNSFEGPGAAPKSPAPKPKTSREEPGKAEATEPLDESLWPKVLQTLKKNHNTLYGVVRMAQPAFSDDGTLKLTFAFAFHEKRLKESSNRSKLAGVVRELTGRPVKVECALDESAKPAPALEEDKPAGPQLDAISNIFGAAELLES